MSVKAFFGGLRRKKSKVSKIVKDEKKKSNVTVESFVKKYEDIFNGLLTGQNVIVYSDSDTDVEVDRPPPPPIPVRLTQKHEKLDKHKQKKQAAVDKINRRKAKARKLSLMLLAKRKAREAKKREELEREAAGNAMSEEVEKETVNKEEEVVELVAETLPKLETKGRRRWKKILMKTNAFGLKRKKKDQINKDNLKVTKQTDKAE